MKKVIAIAVLFFAAGIVSAQEMLEYQQLAASTKIIADEKIKEYSLDKKLEEARVSKLIEAAKVKAGQFLAGKKITAVQTEEEYDILLDAIIDNCTYLNEVFSPMPETPHYLLSYKYKGETYSFKFTLRKAIKKDLKAIGITNPADAKCSVGGTKYTRADWAKAMAYPAAGIQK